MAKKFTRREKIIFSAALSKPSSGSPGGEGVTPDNVRIINNGESRLVNNRAQRTIDE